MPCNPFLYQVNTSDEVGMAEQQQDKADESCTDSAENDRLNRENDSATQQQIARTSQESQSSSHREVARKSSDPPKKRHCRSVSTPCCYENGSRVSHHSGGTAKTVSSKNFPAVDQLHFRVIHPHPHVHRDLPRERHYSGDAAHFYRERHFSGDSCGYCNNNTQQYFCGQLPQLHKPNPIYGSLGSSDLLPNSSTVHASSGLLGPATPHGSPIPRPSSASSKPFDFTKIAKALDTCSEEEYFKIRSFSLSEDHIAVNKARRAACKCGSTQRLSRTYSHPCVAEKKGGIKRKRPKEHKQRPSIDFYKMKEVQ